MPTGLHTPGPSPSTDMKHQVVEQDVARALKQIEKFPAAGILYGEMPAVEPATWDVLQTDHVDSLDGSLVFLLPCL
ncbi:hypothetical protein DFH09DRAFT_1316582 [Mycena vulgaris]|nr:hypothetical protein DFH09DRAFT_1316582 [Mycena vulgaris]